MILKVESMYIPLQSTRREESPYTSAAGGGDEEGTQGTGKRGTQGREEEPANDMHIETVK